MNIANDVKILLEKKIDEAFSNYPVMIQVSPEDAETLWVQVFAVPAARVREVKDFIHDLQDTIGDESGVVLLPMVKNLEVTRQHYPQFAPVVTYSYFAACDYNFATIPVPNYKHAGEFLRSLTVSIEDMTFAFNYQPQRTYRKENPEDFQPLAPVGRAADSELALAA